MTEEYDKMEQDEQLEDLVGHFMSEAKRSGLSSDYDSGLRESCPSTAVFETYFAYHSPLSSLSVVLNTSYEVDFHVDYDNISEMNNYIEKANRKLSVRTRGEPNNVKMLLARAVSKTIPSILADETNLTINVKSPRGEIDLFRFSIGETSDGCFLALHPPDRARYKEKESFERDLTYWHAFYFPVIGKYGNNLLALIKEDSLDLSGSEVRSDAYLCDEDGIIDIGKKAIDLAFKIISDKELDNILYERRNDELKR